MQACSSLLPLELLQRPEAGTRGPRSLSSASGRGTTCGRTQLSGAAFRSRSIRCTVPTPTPSSLATVLMPLPAPRSSRTRRSRSAPTRGRPSLSLGPGAGEAGVDPLADHGPLVLGEDAHHAVHRPARGGGGVEPLLVQEQADAGLVQLLERVHQVRQRAAEAVDRPRGQQVEAAPQVVPRPLAELSERGPRVPASGRCNSSSGNSDEHACILGSRPRRLCSWSSVKKGPAPVPDRRSDASPGTPEHKERRVSLAAALLAARPAAAE